MGYSRTQKKHKIEDIISELPEPLIAHILSYLPTKDVVQTSVLSKGWVNHWTLINKLEFDDSVFYSPEREQHFISFVYRVLRLIKCSSVESFSLVIANKYTWISKILLCCFPSSRIRFQCLKFLKLCGVSFIYDSPIHYRKLVLPSLQKFETRNCSWLGAKGVTIQAPLLENVFIEQDIKSVSDEPPSCKINFFALHLKEFTYCGYGMSQYIFLGKPSSAHNAAANILLNMCLSKSSETRSCAILLLKQFSQAKCINFNGAEVLTQQRVPFLPVFAMLTHLELGQVSGEFLLGLLQKSPVLKTLVFKGILIFDKELLNSAVVPGCFASTLQVVKFEKVNGSEHELYLAQFFLENGMVLERISFSLVSSWLAKSKVMEEFKEKLFSFEKGFSFAIVEFSYE